MSDIKEKFKEIYKEEFDDPNEAFQEFLLSLIPSSLLQYIMSKDIDYYYHRINRYIKL